MDLGGLPVLQWCIRACKAAPGIDEVWVATSTLPADDAIYDHCTAPHIDSVPCWRGSETDVLSRFYDCMIAGIADSNPDNIILRLTGDCPFLDPQVIGGVVRLMKQTPGCHYASNISPRTYPDGLDVQAMTFAALSAAYHEARRPLDRDGVCTWIERNRSRFPAETLINPVPNMQDERWVLDTQDDLKFCRAVAGLWTWEKGPPSMLEIAGILDIWPEIRAINAGGICNERYFAALAEEPIYERTFERSQAAFARAKAVIPLGAQTFSKSHLQYPQPSPLYLTHGQGAVCWDTDGNEYVDLVSALLPVILGYRDPEVDTAIRRQLSSGISLSLATELEAELAETLCRLIPCAEAVRFGKTGTDATSAAIRLARAFTGRDRILICGGYHGWADWSVERNRGVPKAVQELTHRIPLGQLPPGGPEIQWTGNFAAVIIEPENDPSYLTALREWCDRTGTILIFDEVITGFRFDLGGAQKLYGVTPDLACFGKAMANGMPLSAVVGRRDIMKLMEPPDNIFFSGTFFGETLSLAASVATIKKLEEKVLLEDIFMAGDMLMMHARDLISKRGLNGQISLSGGSPALVRLRFESDDIAALFRKEMVASGTLITASHNISAAHGPNEIKRILKSYDHALGMLREAIEKGDVKERLAGAGIGPAVRHVF